MRRKGDDTFAMTRRRMPYVGWREDAGFLLFHFPTWAKARAMQRWIDRSSIAHRPMPTPYSGPQLSVGDGASVS